MLIEIPDDLARKAKPYLKLTDERYRELADDGNVLPSTAIYSLIRAAIVEADLPEPIQVGHLARVCGYEVEVLALGRTHAFFRHSDGYEDLDELDELTYSRPKPEGWGEQ